MKKATISLTVLASLLICITADIRTVFADEIFRIRNASQKYDFIIRMDKACDKPDRDSYGSCEGSASMDIYDKIKKQTLQTLKLDNIFVSFAGSTEPLVNSAQLYDYQGVINVGDFNFDNQEDFAVQNGNNGPYGGPSYDVYLYSASKGKFEISEVLSSLTMETLGFFQVDSKQKLLHTSAKSGCCYHEYVSHQVVNNIPTPVYRMVEDATDPQGETVLITTEKLVNNHWESSSKQIPIKKYYK